MFKFTADKAIKLKEDYYKNLDMRHYVQDIEHYAKRGRSTTFFDTNKQGLVFTDSEDMNRELNIVVNNLQARGFNVVVDKEVGSVGSRKVLHVWW